MDTWHLDSAAVLAKHDVKSHDQQATQGDEFVLIKPRDAAAA